MKFAVVGAGLIGGAAARHLATAGHDVTLIGPGEPLDWSAHLGVFASHYDEGRITRISDPKPFYARVAKAAIARYAEIEQASGIPFFTECGALVAGDPSYMEQIRDTQKEVPSEHVTLNANQLFRKFPFFRFSETITGQYEAQNAGHISPRRLAAAQIKAAKNAGAKHIGEEAQSVTSGMVQVADMSLPFDEIIVAAGGWTDTLLGRVAEHKVYARTVALHQVTEEEAHRLSTMPSLVLRTPDIYVLPPIRYPDGKLWLKLGGDPADKALGSRDAINAWFRSGGSETVGDYLTDQLCALIPGLEFEQRRIAPCITTFTRDGLPEIARVAPGLTIAAAACGAGAKCSDELGRMAMDVARKGDTA